MIQIMRYYIDGYNLLFAIKAHLPKTKKGSSSLEERRRALFLWIEQCMTHASHLEFYLIFDGQKDREILPQIAQFGSLKIEYTQPGQSADQLLIQLAERMKSREALIVVSSDRQIIDHCRLQKIPHLSISLFIQKMQSHAKKGEKRNPSFQRDSLLSPHTLDRYEEIFLQKVQLFEEKEL